MAFYVFDSVLAYNPNTASVTKSAAFQVYDITDTSNSTPLATTDLSGLPVAVRSNSDGMLTIFRVADRKQVKIVSGPHAQVLTSMTGIVDDVEAALGTAADAAAAAQASAQAAAASAETAGTRGVPSGGLPGQGVVKDGVDDYETTWRDIVLLAGGGALRLWGAASTLPPAGSGQQPGDVIFKIGGA